MAAGFTRRSLYAQGGAIASLLERPANRHRAPPFSNWFLAGGLRYATEPIRRRSALSSASENGLVR